MKMCISKILILVFTFALYAGAQDTSFEDFSKDLNNVKAVNINPASNGSTSSPAPTPALTPSHSSISAQAEMPEWLVMVFINARNNLWRAGILDINEMEIIGSTAKIAVTAEIGIIQDKGNSTRFFIQKDTDTSTITSPGVQVMNSDMGSWKHFVNFAKWSIRRHPAKKYMVILWNHGSGRVDIGGADNTGAELGIAYDDLTRNFIRNSQIAMALKEISQYAGKKVDVYSSDACLMQMLSVAYEIKDHAEYLVQSEEIVPGYGFPYDTLLTDLNAKPSSSGEEGARIIVDRYNEFYELKKSILLSSKKGTTMSSIDSNKFPGFVSLLNQWIKLAVKSDRDKIIKALDKTGALEYNYEGHDTTGNARSRDLSYFVYKVNKEIGEGSAFYDKGVELQKYISESLIKDNKTTGPHYSYSRMKGLAVYFPKMIYDTSYDEMLISRDSLWDDFIKWILDESYGIK
ncbi:MAG: hypothetical protein KAR84_01795 [Elusimicrobiales bacterium]|nr:hypothetical protein [Elusimicrobiales bacterium]